MADVVDKATRSRMMSGIKGKNTKPEMQIRKALHAQGLRYKLHDKLLPGKPDLAFPRFRAVIFAQGCFWHGHGCEYFKWPKSNPDFWKEKIRGNVARDAKTANLLIEQGWRVCSIWECALRKAKPAEIERMARRIGDWLGRAGKRKDNRWKKLEIPSNPRR